MSAGREVVPYDEDDQAGRLMALKSGKAIGPVTDTVWSVENGDVTREFVDEEHARRAWDEDGGILDCTVTTSWVSLDGWGES